MTRKLITKAEVCDLIGLSYTTIWARMRAGTFPRSVNPGGRALWYLDEIEGWMEALPRTVLKGDAP